MTKWINIEDFEKLEKKVSELEKLCDEMAYLWRCQGAQFPFKPPEQES